MVNVDSIICIAEMALSSMGVSSYQVFGRFDCVPGEEKEDSPVYRQTHSKEIPTEKEFLLYR